MDMKTYFIMLTIKTNNYVNQNLIGNITKFGFSSTQNFSFKIFVTENETWWQQ